MRIIREMGTTLDKQFMNAALACASQALEDNEVPVGAVVVVGGEIVGRGWNRPVGDHDPSAHAEIVAIRDAAKRLGNYRLTGATLYVTLEPCIMCAGAILNARIERLVFGASDELAGAAGSALNLVESQFMNHQARVERGICEAEASTLLREFFASRRGRDVS